MRRLSAISAGLLLLNAAVFGQVWSFDFVNLDDGVQVTGNPYVLDGLTRESIIWAFTSTEVSRSWHPLPSLTFMVDVMLFGVDNPGAFHLVNLAWHAAATVLLFLLLVRMTGAEWRSALVAALFAVHPLHVESVAWVTERKDVLVAFFWFLTMYAYVGFAERGGTARYFLVLGCFALAVMSKTMTVTLPCVLLLLDFWPLRRWPPAFWTDWPQSGGPPDADHQSTKGGAPDAGNGEAAVAGAMPPPCRPRPLLLLLLEKLPMFAMSAATAFVTFRAHQGSGLTTATATIPLEIRALHALGNYGHYLWKTIWPVGLGLQLPHPLLFTEDPIPKLTWPAAASAVLLIVVTAWAALRLRREPYLAMGWLWFVGTLFPVSGIVQAGSQEVANRFAYLPHVGLFISVVWWIADHVRGTMARRAAAAAGIASVAVCALLAWRQTQVWRDSVTLFEHSLRVVPERNVFAHLGLAKYYQQLGRHREALPHCVKAFEANSTFNWVAEETIGAWYLALDDREWATLHLRRVQDSAPQIAEAYHKRGFVARPRDEIEEEALRIYRQSLIHESLVDSYIYYAQTRVIRGFLDLAERFYREALLVAPANADALSGYGQLKHVQKKPETALRLLELALVADPESAPAHLRMAKVLSELGRAVEAEPHFLRAIELDPELTEARTEYAAFLKSAGRSDEARQYEQPRPAEPATKAPGGAGT